MKGFPNRLTFHVSLGLISFGFVQPSLLLSSKLKITRSCIFRAEEKQVSLKAANLRGLHVDDFFFIIIFPFFTGNERKLAERGREEQFAAKVTMQNENIGNFAYNLEKYLEFFFTNSPSLEVLLGYSNNPIMVL